MATEISYWHRNAKHSQWLDENFKQLVPDSGPASTIEGELVRACSRLTYDFYNNGMINNTSGACNFIREHCVRFINDKELNNCWEIVYNESNTGGYTQHRELGQYITQLIDGVIDYILTKSEYTTMDDDMFNYQDLDFEEEDDESWYDECEEEMEFDDNE